MRALAWLVVLVTCVSPGLRAQPATRAVVLDREGVLRWRDTNEEVALFGANYTLPSAGDFRAAGYLGLDRKKLVDEDMAHFARMGWNALRISFWGDWENTDRAGNLIANEHLDLLDYLIAKARARGIYMLLSPITTYSAEWPDSMQFTGSLGFANHFRKSELGTKDSAIAAQVNYVKQILNHVNPYSGLAYKDDPAIPFVEPINEPIHHSRDVAGSIRYINALVEAVRSAGSRQLVFHNLTQDFAIAQAISRSRMQGISLGWYSPARLRVRHGRHPGGIPVSGDDANVSRGRLAARRDVRVRHDAHGVAQPRVADALSQSRLHAAQGDQCNHRRRGDAARASAAPVRPVSAEHAVRRLPGEL
jgi:hypothetical protein